MTVGSPSTALAGKRSDTGAPEGGPSRNASVATNAQAASPAAHQKAIRQLLAAAPMAPSSAAIVNPAEKATPYIPIAKPRRPAPDTTGTACSPAGKYSPAPRPSRTCAATTTGNPAATAARTAPAVVEARPASISARAPKRPRKAPPTRLATAIDSASKPNATPDWPSVTPN